MQPSVSGVYLLFHRHELVYVGRSADCYHRIVGHRSSGRLFDYSLVTPCPTADMVWVEEALIAAWTPRQNRIVTGGADTKVVLLQRDDPPLAIAKERAFKRVAACGIPVAAFKAALAAGEIPCYPKHPGRTGPGTQRAIPVKDLDAWCEAQQAKRLAG